MQGETVTVKPCEKSNLIYPQMGTIYAHLLQTTLTA